MIKCLGYILYGSAAHATGSVHVHELITPASITSSEQSILGSDHQSLSGCTHRQNTNQLGKLRALLCPNLFLADCSLERHVPTKLVGHTANISINGEISNKIN